MTFFNKLMDKKPKTHSPKETTFPSLSSLLHKSNNHEQPHSTAVQPQNTSGSAENMSVDSPDMNQVSVSDQEATQKQILINNTPMETSTLTKPTPQQPQQSQQRVTKPNNSSGNYTLYIMIK
ncbi:unnamed protein product [Cunninghamella blakesleeana]